LFADSRAFCLKLKLLQRTIREHQNTSVANKVMASLGLPAFESPAPRPNKDALHRILESVVTTNERLAGQDEKIPQTSRILPAVPQFVASAPRFRSAAASWQDAEDPNKYDVDVPVRATTADDTSFSGLYSSGALTTLLAFT
jgi:hypothetical protein